jgi:hypothetical protein
MATLSFQPKKMAKKLLGTLKDRSHDVVVNRYGLSDKGDRNTLESIGQKYGITRERVRQIENAALNSIRKSDEFNELAHIFDELAEAMRSHGTVVAEEDFLTTIFEDEVLKNHLNFFLVLGDQFTRHKENEHFGARWTTDHRLVDSIHEALHDLYASLSLEDLLTEGEIVDRFLENLKEVNEEIKGKEVARRWLGLSKKIAANPLNEWGRHDSKNVKTRGVKDYAFLVLRQHGSPLHFREVAKAIQETFDKKTHPATTHNELIKDDRFVLVGRGSYALSEWGYKPGVVKDVIKDIIKTSGPLTKEEIVDNVMKERFLKRNTILVNLQNPKYFTKLDDGRYDLASSNK